MKKVPLLIKDPRRGIQIPLETQMYLKSIPRTGKVTCVALAGKTKSNKSSILNKLFLDKSAVRFSQATSGIETIILRAQDDILILLDCQGTDTPQSQILQNITLHLSSFYMFNTVGTIDTDSIQQLSKITRSQMKGSEPPHFIWLLTDFNKSIDEQEYLDENIPEAARTLFLDRDLVTIPRSSDSHYNEKVQQLRMKVMNNLKPKKFNNSVICMAQFIQIVEYFCKDPSNLSSRSLQQSRQSEKPTQQEVVQDVKPQPQPQPTNLKASRTSLMMQPVSNIISELPRTSMYSQTTTKPKKDTSPLQILLQRIEEMQQEHESQIRQCKKSMQICIQKSTATSQPHKSVQMLNLQIAFLQNQNAFLKAQNKQKQDVINQLMLMAANNPKQKQYYDLLQTNKKLSQSLKIAQQTLRLRDKPSRLSSDSIKIFNTDVMYDKDKPFIQYNIEVKQDDQLYTIRRKYKAFLQLHDELLMIYPKLANVSLLSTRRLDIEQRCQDLQEYLNYLWAIREIRESTPFRTFLRLQQPNNDWDFGIISRKRDNEVQRSPSERKRLW